MVQELAHRSNPPWCGGMEENRHGLGDTNTIDTFEEAKHHKRCTAATVGDMRK